MVFVKMVNAKAKTSRYEKLETMKLFYKKCEFWAMDVSCKK